MAFAPLSSLGKHTTENATDLQKTQPKMRRIFGKSKNAEHPVIFSILWHFRIFQIGSIVPGSDRAQGGPRSEPAGAPFGQP